MKTKLATGGRLFTLIRFLVKEGTRRRATECANSNRSRPPVARSETIMERAEILKAAMQAVTVDRAATHGDVERTFGAIAAVWSARLGIEITEAQVCIMLVDLKTCRAWNNPAHEDNWIDIAGYAACGGEVAR